MMIIFQEIGFNWIQDAGKATITVICPPNPSMSALAGLSDTDEGDGELDPNSLDNSCNIPGSSLGSNDERKDLETKGHSQLVTCMPERFQACMAKATRVRLFIQHHVAVLGRTSLPVGNMTAEHENNVVKNSLLRRWLSCRLNAVQVRRMSIHHSHIVQGVTWAKGDVQHNLRCMVHPKTLFCCKVMKRQPEIA